MYKPFHIFISLFYSPIHLKLHFFFLESFATDLELFAKHAKRTQINCDDVQLLARKSSTLAAHIDEMSKEMAKAHEADKANRKTKKAKKSKPAQESAAPIEIEDES